MDNIIVNPSPIDCALMKADELVRLLANSRRIQGYIISNTSRIDRVLEEYLKSRRDEK